MAKSENRRPKRPRIRYSRPKPKAKEAEYRNSLGNFELFKTNGINCAHVKKLLNLFEKLIMQKNFRLHTALFSSKKETNDNFNF